MPNITFAFRTLFRTPFVTVVAILSLALGIGANAAIYSLFDQVLLRPLPVYEPGRLVNLAAPGPTSGPKACTYAGSCDQLFSYPMFRDLEASRTGFSGIAAHRAFGANFAYKGQTLSGQGLLVSGSYFSVLGMQPALGRLLVPDDDRGIGSSFVAVLDNNYWQTQLGGDRNVVGQMIVVNGQRLTIVGVAPQGFAGTTLGTKPVVYAPLSMRGVLEPGFTEFDNRRSYWVYLFARLAPGVTMDQAAKAANAVYKPAINEVEAALQPGMSAATMAKFRAKEVTLSDGRRGQSSMQADNRTPLTLLFSITAVVLLIACANIANLLLARSAGRATEMAVRLSLGATRRQLLAQLLIESCLLALLGGVVSLLVANLTLGILAQLLSQDTASTLVFVLQWKVVGFAALLSIGTGILFGLYPALQSTKPDLVTTLRGGSGKLTSERSSARFRSSLVTAQVALSMMLLVAAGLFVKSLMKVANVDLGLSADRVVTFGVSPELNGYSSARSAQFFAQLDAALGAMPGVTNVSSSALPILTGNNWVFDVSVQGYKRAPEADGTARINEVGPGYFKTLGVPVLSGREFTAADGARSPKVAIVNETFAKRFGLGREVVGKFIGINAGDTLDIQIVGLIKDTKYSSVKQSMPPLAITAARQDTTLGSIQYYVRTAGDPAQLIRIIPSIVAKLDANLPIESPKTLPQQVKENVYMDRMISALSAAFATLATLLAAIGLYGVLAYSVAQRTREIGIRMALGADMRSVRAMIMRQVGRMTLIGCVIGLAGALVLGRSAASLLYQMTSFDPVVFIGAAVTLSVVALGAGYLPAFKASRVDPTQALRYE